MLVRAPIVVTIDGAPIHDGVVQVEGERIAAVSKSNIKHRTSNILELRDHVLLPGLINAHCHLDYTCLRGQIPPQNSFTDWIRAINAAKAKLTPDDYVRSIEAGLDEARRFGTTAMVNLEAFAELIARISPTALRVWWCAELIDVSAPDKSEESIEGAVRQLRAIKEARDCAGLAPHALFTASAELYGRCEEIAGRNNFILTTHLAESREEMEMFRERAGPLYEFIKSFGRDCSDCGGTTPVGRFVELQGAGTLNASGGSVAVSSSRRSTQNDAPWLVAHLNELTEGDFQLLRLKPVGGASALHDKFSIVHCPRSHQFFGHSPFQYERLRNLGFNICLGTDSLASNADLSLFAEMRRFSDFHPQLSAREILEMVTLNPAKALGRGSDLAKIAPGFLADLIALPLHGSGDVYQQILAFRGDVPWMMINGQPI